MNVKDETEGEGTSRPEPRRLDVLDGEDEEEESMAGTILQVSLHPAPFIDQRKIKLPTLWRTFSVVAWCGRSNLIACATEVCAKEPGVDSQPLFWIPVHIVSPERPTEHTVFNVAADSPCESICSLEWSPLNCPRALLVANSCGRVTVWTQPTQGLSNAARSVNCWNLEHEWRQDQAITTKWLSGVSPYRWTATSSSSKPSFEEKFLSHQLRSSARWPNFLCVCSIFSSGSVQLHWCQWPPSQLGISPKWFSTSKGILGAGPSGIITGDAVVNESGSLLVAGVPIGNPSTVVVWEVSPWNLNSPGSSLQIVVKPGASVPPPLSFTAPNWPGIAPLAAYLLSWQDNLGIDSKGGQLGVDTKFGPLMKEAKTVTSVPDTGQGQPQDNDEIDAPLLQCSPVSNLSAYVTPEAASQSGTTGWRSGVGVVAFDPSRGGLALVVLVIEGNIFLPHTVDEEHPTIAYRIQRWESSRQQVGIHPLFESAVTSYSGSSHQTITTWKSTVDKSLPPSKHIAVPGESDPGESDIGTDEQMKIIYKYRPTYVRPRSRIVFSAHGGEVAVALFGGDVHTFSGTNLTPFDSYYVGGTVNVCPAFSSAGCCLSTVWHDSRRGCSVLKIMRVHPPPIPGMHVGSIGTSFERILADRFWWCLVSEVDWWDAVGCTQSAVEDGVVTFQRVIAVLDADFHALPTLSHRQHYGPALDRIKCRMLEGVEGSDVRAVVLDMQARLLLEMLGRGIEAALINPATFITEPWQASSETLTQLVPDAMAVDSSLVPYIQWYVEAVLDLASHFLTRLRRYASFCRTLASHAANTASSSAANNRLPSTTSGSSGTAPPPAQGSQTAPVSNNGAASVQAWVQGAIAKVNNTAEGGVSVTSTAANGTVPPIQLSVSQAAFPGMPAVRLIGDCHFLHRLCQLLLFCLIFRRRQLLRFTGTPPRNLDGGATAAKPVTLFTGKGSDEVMTSSSTGRSTSAAAIKTEEFQNGRGSGGPSMPAAKVPDDSSSARSGRLGSGNAGQGYTSEEVKFLFLVCVDLCKRTSSLPHPMPKSHVGTPNPSIRLHYPDGQFSVAPEVVEASLGPHIQNLPRPRGADSAGLLMRELELHPPAEDWSKRNVFGGPWASGSFGSWSAFKDSSIIKELWPKKRQYAERDISFEDSITKDLWPKKRRYAERDTAFGQTTAVGMGRFLGFMGSQRDVITTSWKTTPHGIWHKCMRCGRQTCALVAPRTAVTASQLSADTWWAGRWAYACPMCGGLWVQVV